MHVQNFTPAILTIAFLSLGMQANAQKPESTINQDSIRKVVEDANREALNAISQSLSNLEKQLNEQRDEMNEETRDALEDAIDELKDAKKDLTLSADTTKKKNKRIIMDDHHIEIKYGTHSDSADDARKRKKMFKTEWLGLDLGINLLQDNGSFALSKQNQQLELRPSKSLNPTLYIVRQGISFSESHKTYLTYGLAVDFHDYAFRKDITLIPKADSLVISDPGSIEFRKNKLSAQYLTIPVMLNFQSKPFRPSRSFKVAAGAYGGILINSYTKQVSRENGKQKFHDDYNLNNFTYGLAGQIGFGNLQFYAHYSLAPLFEPGKASELNSVTFGIVLINDFHWD